MPWTNFHIASSTAALSLFAIAVSPAFAQSQTVKIGTLEWPPYVGATLPQEGATTAVLKEALKRAGYEAEIVFLPWARAVDETAKADGEIIAFYPGYHCKQREGLIGSESMGSGPLGFAERVDTPLAWSSLDDLSGKTIGVVKDYANTPDFDARTADGRIKADVANTDVLNLRKLVGGRIDAAVVDRFVMDYLMRTDEALKGHVESVRFNEKPLDDKTLHLCVRDSEAGRKLVEDFNAALSQFDVEAFTRNYFETSF